MSENPSRGPTVSIVIPCYNAAPWLRECLDSALAQNHAPTEIILVDDGSTDGSADIARAYGERITFLQQANSGGNVARNAGLKRATGEYVQFLDADDVILPEKIEHQVAAAEETGADAVYSDWRHRFSLPDEPEYDGPVEVMGAPDDVLLALLDGWWVSPAAILFRRSTAEEIGGWDEELRVAQDRDFFTRIAMHTDRIAYVPRCDAIYRRMGPVTVATSNPQRYTRGHLLVSQKLEAMLRASGRLSPAYAQALARNYVDLARQLARFDKDEAAQVFAHARSLSPDAEQRQSRLFQILLGFLGYHRTERVYDLINSMRGRV